ncbi:RHS repeat-associated core domain-containing protein, partial [Streptomyces rubellomurinus]
TLTLATDEITLDSAGTVSNVRSLPAPGGLTFTRSTTADGGSTVQIQAADPHGTNGLQIGTDAAMTVTRRAADPFGNPRGTQPAAGQWAGTKGFVGGSKDDATGLTSLGARQYDPATGRFISPDPLMDEADPQQWNGYAYSDNDPVNLSDPSGLRPDGVCGGFGACRTPEGQTVQETWTSDHGVWTDTIRKSRPHNYYRPPATNSSTDLPSFKSRPAPAQTGGDPCPAGKKICDLSNELGEAVQFCAEVSCGVYSVTTYPHNDDRAHDILRAWLTDTFDHKDVVNFGAGDPLLMDLTKQQEVKDTITKVLDNYQAKGPQAIGEEVRNSYEDTGKLPDSSFPLNKVGVLLGIADDVTGVLTNGNVGTNYESKSILGSFNVYAKVTNVQQAKNGYRIVDIHFRVDDQWDWNSATKLVPRGWNPQAIPEGDHDRIPGRAIKAHFEWGYRTILFPSDKVCG